MVRVVGNVLAFRLLFFMANARVTGWFEASAENQSLLTRLLEHYFLA